MLFDAASVCVHYWFSYQRYEGVILIVINKNAGFAHKWKEWKIKWVLSSKLVSQYHFMIFYYNFVKQNLDFINVNHVHVHGATTSSTCGPNKTSQPLIPVPLHIFSHKRLHNNWHYMWATCWAHPEGEKITVGGQMKSFSVEPINHHSKYCNLYFTVSDRDY